MQCVIDATETAFVRPAFWRNLQFNLLRHGFDNILLLANPNIAQHPFPPFRHPDLPVGRINIINDANAAAILQREDLLPEDSFLYLNASWLPVFNWLDLAARAMQGGKLLKAECHENGNYGAAYWMRRDCLINLPHQHEGSLHEALMKMEPETISIKGCIWKAAVFPDESLVRKAAVFLDRDGVLNRDIGYAHLWKDWEWIPGARQSIKAMNDAGWLVFVVSNQSGVARGFFPENDVLTLHAAIQEDLGGIGAHIDAFRYCPWLDDAPLPQYRKKSDWRKPEPGMLADICKHWPIDMRRSFMVGDKESDLAAGRAMGLPSFLFREAELDLPAIAEKIG